MLLRGSPREDDQTAEKREVKFNAEFILKRKKSYLTPSVKCVSFFSLEIGVGNLQTRSEKMSNDILKLGDGPQFGAQPYLSSCFTISFSFKKKKKTSSRI